MSKKTTQANPSIIGSLVGPSYGQAILVTNHKADYVLGKILTLIELVGLKEPQLQSLKDLIKQEFWNINDYSQYMVTAIPDNVHTAIQEYAKKFKKEQRIRNEKEYGEEFASPVSEFDYQAEYELVIKQ